MHLPGSRLALRRLAVVATLALVGSLVYALPSLAASGTRGKDHFVPSASDSDSANGGESGDAADTRSPAHFDQEALTHPVKGTQGLFSQCRFAPFANTTSLYPALSANEHDVINGDTTFALANNTSCYNPQNEQNIVVNPTNSQNVVTSANDYRGAAGNTCMAYASFDGGATWTDYTMGGWTFADGANGQFVKTGCGGDPVLAFGPDGSLYYAGLTFNLDKFPREMSGVAVTKSTDGGKTWQKPVMVSYNATGNFFYDKPWISVGPDGTVNLTWTKFYQGPKGLSYLQSPIVLSQSKNGGKAWSSVKQVSDAAHPFDQGSQSATGPNGTLYITYEAGDPSTGYVTDEQALATSTDGGTTFTTSKIGRVFDDLDCYPIQLPGAQGRQTLTGEQFRLPSNASLALDPTSGNLAITWADDEGAGSCGNLGTTFTGTTSNQVKVYTSTDGGSSWTLHRITSSAPDKWFSSVAYSGGLLAVGYETRDYATTSGDPNCEAMLLDSVTLTITPLSTANVCYDQAVTYSTDDGSTWSGQIRVSSVSSNPYMQFAGAFIGDYEGTAIGAHGTIYTVWTDNRGNPGVTWPNQDTYVGTVGTVAAPTHH
jgi:hypothetical protein